MVSWKKIYDHVFKLPFMISLIVLGFMMEIIFTFPFVMVYYLDRLSKRRLLP